MSIATSEQCISGSRFLLRPFAENMITDAYIGWLNDPDLMRFSRQRRRMHTVESCREYLKSFENSASFFWSAHSAETGTHIGNLSAYVDTDNKVADLAILIGHPSA